MDAATATAPNGAAQAFKKLQDTFKNPKHTAEDVVNGFSELLKLLDGTAKMPGRDTDELTPEREARIKKMSKELQDVVLMNTLEHGIDKNNDVILLASIIRFVRSLDELIPGGNLSRELVVRLAEDDPAFEVRVGL